MKERVRAEFERWRGQMKDVGVVVTPEMEIIFARGMVSAFSILSDHPSSARLTQLAVELSYNPRATPEVKNTLG